MTSHEQNQSHFNYGRSSNYSGIPTRSRLHSRIHRMQNSLSALHLKVRTHELEQLTCLVGNRRQNSLSAFQHYISRLEVLNLNSQPFSNIKVGKDHSTISSVLLFASKMCMGKQSQGPEKLMFVVDHKAKIIARANNKSFNYHELGSIKENSCMKITHNQQNKSFHLL